MMKIHQLLVGHTVFSCYGNVVRLELDKQGNVSVEERPIPIGHTKFSWGVRDYQGDDGKKKARAMNKLGALFRKRGKFESALQLYRSALELDPCLVSCHFNLGCLFDDLRQKEDALESFRIAFVMDPSFSDAVNCYTGLVMKTKKAKEDFNYVVTLCRSLLLLEKDCKEAHWNYQNALRRAGRREEAIDFAFQALGIYPFPKRIDCSFANQSSIAESTNCIHVVCVKWGTKYDAEYVNKLFRGCERNIQVKEMKVVCFTDDSKGIDERVTCFPLPFQDWEGWWNKPAVLFSEYLEAHIQGRIMYIDLDTVIIGSLDDIVQYNGNFATLGTDDFTATEGRIGGYNSSIMLFDARNERLKQIFHTIHERGLPKVMNVIHRFDYWLEMLVANADILQATFPGQLLDYKTHIRNNNHHEPISDAARILNFPLDPKPHQCQHEPIVAKHWT